MGNCASADGEKGKPRTNEDPELMGKAKFLSCPSLSEITDPSQTKWLLLVFAPLTHHGLIFAARSTKDGTLLVKDIVDKQVAKEKEEQRVQLSYNLFFKAISTEVAKAGRSGAKVEWQADGSLSVECKIAISGSASSNKKPDTYTALLKPVDATESNLFRYIVEPLATHYCKKRTDGWNLDRPDPHKEKMYGEQEANAIMRSASMRSSQQVLDRELPTIVPLRQDHATARAERDAALAKVNLMKQMLLAKSAAPPLLRVPPTDAFGPIDPVDCGMNVVAAAMEPHLAFPKPADVNAVSSHSTEIPPPAPSPMTFEHLQLQFPKENPLFHVACAAVGALGLPSDNKEVDRSLKTFFHRMDIMHRQSNAFHNAVRAAERLQAFVNIVLLALRDGFKPDPTVLFAAFIGAVVHDVDHCGLNNQQGMTGCLAGYIPTTYSFASQVERHSLAVGLAEALGLGIQVDVDTVATVVLATDLTKHQEFVGRLQKRSNEIADFSRRYDDQVLAFSSMLKAADLSHLYKTKSSAEVATAQLAAEVEAGDAASGLPSTGLSNTSLFVKHVALPLLQTLQQVFPSTSFAFETAKANFDL